MDASNDRDEWLMARTALGEVAPLEPLIRRYASPLLTFIRRMVGDEHDSEELFQETFLAVWEKRRQYKFPRPFKPWLYAIAVNKCRASYRRRRPQVGIADEEGSTAFRAAEDRSPLEGAIATESATLVQTAIARLTPHQREVVVLRIWNGQSYAEIAEAVGRTEATVRSHMHHALASLRDYLEPRLG